MISPIFIYSMVLVMIIADVIFGLQRQEEANDDLRTLKIVASRNSGLAEVP